MTHPQGRCPAPVELLHLLGDPTRATYRLCAEDRAIYEGMGMVFVPATTPEWAMRAAEKRLPAKVAA